MPVTDVVAEEGFTPTMCWRRSPDTRRIGPTFPNRNCRPDARESGPTNRPVNAMRRTPTADAPAARVASVRSASAANARNDPSRMSARPGERGGPGSAASTSPQAVSDRRRRAQPRSPHVRVVRHGHSARHAAECERAGGVLPQAATCPDCRQRASPLRGTNGESLECDFDSCGPPRAGRRRVNRGKINRAFSTGC